MGAGIRNGRWGLLLALSACSPTPAPRPDAAPDAPIDAPADAPVGPDGPPPDAPPGPSQVLRLDGDGDGVELPRNAELGGIGAHFTVELWFRPVSADVFERTYLLIRRAHHGDYTLGYSHDDDGRVHFDVRTDDATSTTGLVELASTTRPDVARWHHVAGVVDGREVRLYLDGKLEAAATAPSDITWRPDDPRASLHPEYRLLLGHTRSPDDAGSRYAGRLRGELDDVRVSRAARYTGEVFEPPTTLASDPDTVGLWTFEEPGGPTAEDTGPSAALDGTIVGAVRVAGGR
jgi:hypothetical protein